MEAKLGRLLEREEVVHHVNGVKHDNRPDNLIVLQQSEHMTLHGRKDRVYDVTVRARMAAAGRKGAAARWANRSLAESEGPQRMRDST
jgi:hypothetical protein